MRDSNAVSRSSSNRATSPSAKDQAARSAQRRPPPEAERVAQQRGGLFRPALVQRALTVRGEREEAIRVQRLDPKRIAGGRSVDHSRLFERRAQARHVDLDGLDRGGGRFLAPKSHRQSLRADRRIGV